MYGGKVGTTTMTKQAALQKFFESFGLPAYTTNNVPDDVIFPWLTYEARVGNPGDNPISSVVNVWYRTESEALPNAKVEEIANAITDGGIVLPYDGGAIWIQRGEPWCIPLNDENDSAIKRRQMNVTFNFL